MSEFGGQPGLYGEVQVSQGCIMRPRLEEEREEELGEGYWELDG